MIIMENVNREQINMFEDDLDIDFDEVLNYSESSNLNLKRNISKAATEEQSKKAKNSHLESNKCVDNLSPKSDHGTKSISPTPSKKTFNFKKVTTNTQNDIKSSLLNFSNEENASGSMNLNFMRTNSTLSTVNGIIEQNYLKNSPNKVCSRNNNSFDVNITRKFPGPAGLLPKRYSKCVEVEDLDKSTHSVTKEETCSQSTCLILNEGPWQKMRVEFLPKSPEDIYLPDKYNIQWIKSRVMMRKLINQKAPFLAAFVHRISSHSIQNPIVNLILKDKTGTIQGTILHNLYEEYSNELVVGAVIVLKELGVLNAGSKSEPYLTITSNNLISIYTNLSKFGTERDTFNKEQSKVIVQNISVSEICSNIKELKRIQKLELESSKSRKTPSLSSETLNICDNFKRAVYNTNNKQQNIQLQPHLNNLRTHRNNSNTNPRTKIVTQDKSKLTTKHIVVKPSNKVSNNTEDIDDIMDLFNTQEGLDEFFNEEPNFCSPQISVSNETKQGFTRNYDVSANFNATITMSSEKENRLVLEDMLEGLDTDALFDDF